MDNLHEENAIRFCAYCGTELDLNAKFCKSCGKSIDKHSQDSDEKKEEPTPDNYSERKTVFEGTIHKCPNCGETLKSFTTNCPSCGFEIRDVRSVSSTKELENKLQQIDAKILPLYDENQSVMKKILGNDFQNNEVKERTKKFEEQKLQEKATVIINYSIPNTKEDILEFMILATSNINTKEEMDDVVSKAWIIKMEQVFQKAKVSINDCSDFENIETIYYSKIKQIKIKKLKRFFIGFVSIVVPILLLGFMLETEKTIIFSIMLTIIVITGIIIYLKTGHK